jgi:hypothetical protein
MIRHAVDGDQLLFFVANDTGNVFVQLFFVLFGNKILPTLHGEHDMDIDLGNVFAIFCIQDGMDSHVTPTEFS